MFIVAILAMLTSIQTQAQFATNITDIVENATTLFGTVQTLVISIVGFGIAVWVINKLRRR